MTNPRPSPAVGDAALRVAILVFNRLDQLDATGPFEVLAQMSNVRVDLVSSSYSPVVDMRGLTLLPTATLTEVTATDVLVVPGGAGPRGPDGPTRRCSAGYSASRIAPSSCSRCAPERCCWEQRGCCAVGARRAHDLLPFFGAVPVRERVVVDGSLLTAAGVTAGIDGALLAVARLRGEDSARAIQLGLEILPCSSVRGRQAGKYPTQHSVARRGLSETPARTDAWETRPAGVFTTGHC